MKYAVTGCEMKTYDQRTIEEIRIPAMVLMERAALATVDVILQQSSAPDKVLVVAGTGNNGGDGLAVGRLLALQGRDVDFVLAGNRNKLTKETKQQLEILEHLGFSIQSKFEKQEYNIVIDALFGIGLTREITGEYKELVETMNHLREQGAHICAIDISSGISAENGQIFGSAVRADFTVTYAFAKKGHLLYPGKEYTGKIFVKDIGITEHVFHNQQPTAFYCEEKDVQTLLPLRKANGNKGTFGKVLLLAGSRDMSGACILCGNSILRTGAGMVKIITPDCNREIIQETLPEAMLYTYEAEPMKEKILQAIGWADVIVAGPGLGTDVNAYFSLKCILETSQKPLVIDADGLNLIAKYEDLQDLAQGQKQLIITPHPGELIRLMHTDMEEYRMRREALLVSLAENMNCIVAGKDAVTLVIQADKEQKYINTSGNDGMATAGSGDVLAGIIGGLLAQGTELFRAAYLGVYLHGLAGDEAARKKGSYGMLASDIIKELPFVMNEL